MVMHGAEPTSEPAAPTQNEQTTVVLDPVEVTGQNVDDAILPLEKPVGSLFGPFRDTLQSPRTVSVLSEEVLREAGVRGLRDIALVSPNTDTPNTFGVPSLPRIRGQEGEIFQNGMRREGGNNGFGLPISFNAFDRIDVVKGPATPVLGPTQRVGGYIDLHTKQPNLDRTTGSVTIEAGSYEHKRGVIDISTLIVPGKSAIRVSYERVDSGSFYDFVENESDSLFIAYTNKFNENVRLDLNAEYYKANYSDNAGWNRVTQDLIDNGTYITGTGISPVTGAVPGPGAVISPTGEVQLSRRRVLTDPDDFSKAETFVAQAALEIKLSPDTTLTNRTFFQNLTKDQVNQNSFVEIIDEDYTIENRTELAKEFALHMGGLDLDNKTVSGLDLRFHHVVGFSQFTTESDNAIDLTAPISSRRIPLSAVKQVLAASGLDLDAGQGLVELRPGVFVSPGFNHDINGDGVGDFFTSDTNETDHFQAGLFHQHDLRFNEHWSVLFGGRIDLHHVESRDPIAPAGFSASDTITELQGAGNVSLVYAPTKRSSYYATYSYTESTSNALGGGFTLDGNGELAPERFNTESELVEIGAKYSLFNDTLFLSTAAYYQTRSLRNRDGSQSKLNVQGLEAEATYRPNRNFFSLAGISYTDARFDNQSVFQGTGSINDAFDNSRPDIIAGTGIGSPNFTVFPPGDHRFPGLPRVSINALASYTFDSGFGASLGGVWTSEQNLDVLGRVVIPSQITLNGAIFYRQPRYEIRLDVLNLTDEENFSTVFNGFFGADLVIPEEPIRMRVSATYKF